MLKESCFYVPTDDLDDDTFTTLLARLGPSANVSAVMLQPCVGLLQYVLYQDADCSEGLALSWLHSGVSLSNISIFVCVCVCVYIYLSVYIYIYIYHTWKHRYGYLNMHIYIYICIYTYIYIYT